MKNRPARVRELIQRELGAVIAKEMNFTTLVTVQAVDLTADFKHCHVHVGVLADEPKQRDVIQALAAQRPHLQHELSRRVVLKYTPRLHFHLDHSVERGTKITEIMRHVDEITPPEEPTAGDDAVNPRAAKDAIDMETQDRAQEQRDQEDAARREIETDGADDEQDGIFEELTPAIEDEDSATATAATAAKAEKPDRHARPARSTEHQRAVRATEDDQADE